ncbi:LPXTG cell wall anchor domain-containing protein [Enterococcus hirae]
MFNKTKSKLYLVILCFLLCLPACVGADTIDSHNTTVKVELKRNHSEQVQSSEELQKEKKQSPNLSKKRQESFPQTGEIMNHWYSWIGVCLLILISTIYYFKKNKSK